MTNTNTAAPKFSPAVLEMIVAIAVGNWTGAGRRLARAVSLEDAVIAVLAASPGGRPMTDDSIARAIGIPANGSGELPNAVWDAMDAVRWTVTRLSDMECPPEHRTARTGIVRYFPGRVARWELAR